MVDEFVWTDPSLPTAWEEQSELFSFADFPYTALTADITKADNLACWS